MSTEKTVQERVFDVVTEKFALKPEERASLTLETSFVNDLGADSLDGTEMILELEEEFDVKISDAKSEKALKEGTVSAIVNCMTSILEQSPAST